ncbi:LOW QUALITY PROTEIN: hypothetical protein PHMEG_0009758 [Phytophthora megakarya]|uniref:Uncharacterized protein n=1 Tax=Phytophthora megakarya TaxID=4795 RepID=A0A225WGS5_9STRA|nr:LOW QUALITY PROTEIN: hypothetical protein PHMEG_0009758 [Phytophthora megakarya]
MDCLQARLAECGDPIETQHHQTGGRRGSTLFVDDQIDITSTEQGAQERAKITNVFTGKTGTGGIFGTSMAFMMYLTHGNEHFQAVSLNDGMDIPRQVQVVSPSERFKRLGIYQSGDDLWEATVSPVDIRFQRKPSVFNASGGLFSNFDTVWVPRLRYRMILGGAFRLSGHFDTFIRQVARSVLRLPHPSPRSIYYDQANGIGLLSCDMDAAMKPPLRCECEWKQPTTACSERSNDKPLISNYALLVTCAQSLGLDCSRKLNCVGKRKRKGAKRGNVDTLYAKWKTVLTTECSLMLRDPVEWVKVPVGIVPYQPRIGVEDWIVALALDTSGTEPILHHYELSHRDIAGGGVRSKDTVTFDMSELTYETSRNLKMSAFLARIILWTDTVDDGVHGVNDREILLKALKRSQLCYESTLESGRPIELATACSEFGRHRGAQWCGDCKKWHHPICLPVWNTSGNATGSRAQQRYLSYTWQTGSGEVTIQAGDGSVIQANTPAAHGGWAMQTVEGPAIMGQLYIQRQDITSTRCEMHGLLAGMQSQKPPPRHPMTTDEVSMTSTEEWTDALRRFYWRARILNTTSTNDGRKHVCCVILLIEIYKSLIWARTTVSGGRSVKIHAHRSGLISIISFRTKVFRSQVLVMMQPNEFIPQRGTGGIRMMNPQNYGHQWMRLQRSAGSMGYALDLLEFSVENSKSESANLKLDSSTLHWSS